MRTTRSLLSATMLLAGTATAAQADPRPLFEWAGTVDHELIITIRGANLDMRGDGFDYLRTARFQMRSALPRVNGSIRVRREDGRGDVDVIEQPSPFNNYTARVRVRDARAGADRYRLEAVWIPAFIDDRRDRREDDRYDRRGDEDRRDRMNDRDRWDRPQDIRFRRDAGVLRFSARIDDVAEVRIRGRRVEYFAESGRPIFGASHDLDGAAMPQYAVPLDLRRFAGRGNVVITQYPREWNDWTTVIRIEDRRAGADLYTFDLRW